MHGKKGLQSKKKKKAQSPCQRELLSPTGSTAPALPGRPSLELNLYFDDLCACNTCNRRWIWIFIYIFIFIYTCFFNICTPVSQQTYSAPAVAASFLISLPHQRLNRGEMSRSVGKTECSWHNVGCCSNAAHEKNNAFKCQLILPILPSKSMSLRILTISTENLPFGTKPALAV